MAQGSDIVAQLQRMVSSEQVLTSEDSKTYYTKGFRVGSGKALAVALPATLSQLWAVLQACVACDNREQRDAFLVRFGVGGCTLCYCDYKGIDANQRLVAFDVALRRNDSEWRIRLPPALQKKVQKESCCGHFFCFVNQQEEILAVKKKRNGQDLSDNLRVCKAVTKSNNPHWCAEAKFARCQ